MADCALLIGARVPVHAGNSTGLTAGLRTEAGNLHVFNGMEFLCLRPVMLAVL